MKNNQYWINRISNNFLDTEKSTKKIARETEKHYNKALKNINNEIARLYARFENDNQIKLDEALKILNITEMQDWKMSMKEYLHQIKKTGDESLLLELNTLAMQSRVTRLEALKQVINAESEILRYNLDSEVGKHLSKIVKNTHKSTLYGFFEQDLINMRDMVDISSKDIQDILKLKWHGGNYSSRIWNNTKKLAEFSKNSVISALGSGRSYDNIIKDLKGEFEQNRRYELERVVRTESAFVHTQAEKKAFKAAEIEEYRISAHLDSRTSQKCTNENGNIYKLNELEVGYNAPPFHPNCRSIIVPVTEFDEDTGKIVKEKEGKLINSEEKIDVNKGKSLVKEEKIDYNEIKLEKLKEKLNPNDFNEFHNILINNNNEDVKKLYKLYADDIKDIQISTQKAYYLDRNKSLTLKINSVSEIELGRNKFSTIAHEYGHFYDYNLKNRKLNYNELNRLREILPNSLTPKDALSVSDEFLNSVRKDKGFLQSIGFNKLKMELYSHDASAGVQDAIDGMFEGSKFRIRWGHGEKYYNRKYSNIVKFQKELGTDYIDNLKKIYSELGYKAGPKSLIRDYETASEMWANILSAETCGGKELEFIKKYLPNSYITLIQIIKGV